jgi:transcriptional regulator with XRE-family HTH domain
VALGVFRLIIVASIFAFVLTVRTVAPILAASGDPADDPTPVVDPSSVTAEDPPINPPPPTEPPTEPPPIEAEPPPVDAVDPVEPPPIDPPPPGTTVVVVPPAEPPVEAEPPPADPIEPAPTDAPPADIVEVEPPAEPPVEVEPPPADTIEPTPTDPPADPPADPAETVLPPPDPPVHAVPPLAEAVEPAPADPPVTDALPPPLEDPSIVSGDPTGSHPSTAQSAPSVPSTHRSAVPAPRVADNPPQAATMPVALTSTLVGQTDPSPERAHTIALHPAIATGAGLAAGLAITNHAPSSVAVAVEFGRAGGGWAGALVFNLWLRRQMRERRMSQRRLASLADVDHSTISRLLRQDRRPSLTTATKLARALKQVPGEGAEPEAVDYFERVPEETVFPARRVELALRADEMLNDDQVRRLMNIYLEARRRNQASAPAGSARSRAAPARAAPDAS